MKKNRLLILFFVFTFIVSSTMGGIMGFLVAVSFSQENNDLSSFISEMIPGTPQVDLASTKEEKQKTLVVEEESAIISVVEKTSPAVVSIIVSKDLPVIEKYYDEPSTNNDFFSDFFGSGLEDFFRKPKYRQNGTETQEIGGGTGFLVSSDGYIVTNKHVVFEADADYTVIMNNEKKYPAEVLARDAYNDLAIIKINGEDFPYIELGDSSNLKVGQSVVAIGNSLGEFSNTVSTGIVSGLARNLTAEGRGISSEELVDVIQTDASINPGNSGGPLLNLSGQVIGINTAIAANAENIGFALPVDTVKKVFDSVKEHGKIVRPWLGVRYVMINEVIAEKNNLKVDYGALIVRGEKRTDLAVIPGSPADRADLMENDIILEINGNKIDSSNPLSREIGNYKPKDKIKLKILHKGDEKIVELSLEEMDDV